MWMGYPPEPNGATRWVPARRSDRHVGEEVSGGSRRGPGLEDLGGKSEVPEDLVDDAGVLDGGEQDAFVHAYPADRHRPPASASYFGTVAYSMPSEQHVAILFQYFAVKRFPLDASYQLQTRSRLSGQNPACSSTRMYSTGCRCQVLPTTYIASRLGKCGTKCA